MFVLWDFHRQITCAAALSAANKIEAAVSFILIDAEARILAGAGWLDTCAWHADTGD